MSETPSLPSIALADEEGRTLENLFASQEFRLKLQRVLNKYGISSQDQQDLLQETYELALQKTHEIRNYEAWMIQTLQNRCIMHLRKKRRREEVDPIVLEFREDKRTLEELEHFFQFEDVLRFFIAARLSPRDICITWLKANGILEKRIGEYLGHVASTIRKRYNFALRKLRRAAAQLSSQNSGPLPASIRNELRIFLESVLEPFLSKIPEASIAGVEIYDDPSAQSSSLGEEPQSFSVDLFYREERKSLLKVIHRYKIFPPDDEDILQEAFRIFLNKLQKGKSSIETTYQNYMIGIISKLCLQLWRKRRGDDRRIKDEDMLELYADETSLVPVQREFAREQLQKLLEKTGLSEKQSSLLFLRAQGASEEEVEARTGYKESGVRTRYSRLLRQIRKANAISENKLPNVEQELRVLHPLLKGRQYQIIFLLEKGFSDEEIAEALEISKNLYAANLRYAQKMSPEKLAAFRAEVRGIDFIKK